MTQLIWDASGERQFEGGVDRGVLYLADNSGVVWNGLRSVEEQGESATRPLYQDGIKNSDLETFSDFSAILRAFTYPDEFEEFDGVGSIGGGLFVDNQPVKQFGLSYRTRIGNDIDGTDHGYQIHILYNLTSAANANSFLSLSNQVAPIEFSWTLLGTPVTHENIRPTTHLILDSTELDPEGLQAIENALYGTSTTEAYLPSIDELISLSLAHLIVIVDHGDGTWSAIGPDELITMPSSTTFQITEANATYSDSGTYQISDS